MLASLAARSELSSSRIIGCNFEQDPLSMMTVGKSSEVSIVSGCDARAWKPVLLSVDYESGGLPRRSSSMVKLEDSADLQSLPP